MREELAVGLIETRGLVAAIEACDAALKSADVKLISIDRADAGLMTVKVVGQVAAVQSAVDAGRVGMPTMYSSKRSVSLNSALVSTSMACEIGI